MKSVVVFCMLIGLTTLDVTGRTGASSHGDSTSTRKMIDTVAKGSASVFCQRIADTALSTSNGIALVEAYGAEYAVSNAQLFCTFRKKSVRSNVSLFSRILYFWKKTHPVPLLVLQQYQQAGDIRAIDTLCAILDYRHTADVPVLMRWIDAKKILDDYKPVPELFCRILDDKRTLLPLVLNQFSHLLKELEVPHSVQLLCLFSDCVRPQTTADSSEVLSWLLKRLGEHAAVAKQVQLTKRFLGDTTQRSSVLQAIADWYHDRGQWDEGIYAADAGYHAATTNEQQQKSATLLFTLYTAAGKSDSAGVWLERSDITSASDAAAAIAMVVVYQNTGALDAAARSIEQLPKSRARDTLYVRQLLLSDSASKALTHVQSASAFALSFPGSFVWRLRCALFAGNNEEVFNLVTHLAPEVAAQVAPQVTEYRYWITRLKESPEELAKFGQIEYTMFKGDRGAASELVCSMRVDLPVRWRFATHVSRRQMDHGEFEGAFATLRCAPAEEEPEYLYCVAEALFSIGKKEKALRAATKILTAFPTSIYAAKARPLLMRLKTMTEVEE